MDNESLIALGRIAAIERAMGALIATHPDPELLARFWQEVEPAWRRDLQREYGDAAAQPFLRAATQGLDRLAVAVRAAERVRATPIPG